MFPFYSSGKDRPMSWILLKKLGIRLRRKITFKLLKTIKTNIILQKVDVSSVCPKNGFVKLALLKKIQDQTFFLSLSILLTCAPYFFLLRISYSHYSLKYFAIKNCKLLKCVTNDHYFWCLAIPRRTHCCLCSSCWSTSTLTYIRTDCSF